MPRKTILGHLSSLMLRLTPVRHAARDHDQAFKIVINSGLDWTLAGCPWIKDGDTLGAYRTSLVFPGGMRTIHPGDIAHFLVSELAAHRYPNSVVGIWY
jgi:hypothetical protein